MDKEPHTHAESQKTLLLSAEDSRFRAVKLDTDVPDGRARLTVFFWLATIFVVVLFDYTGLSAFHQKQAADQLFTLLDKYFVVFAGAIGFYLKDRAEK